MNTESLAVFGVAFVFVIVGLQNRFRGKGPWRAFLFGGIALAILEALSLAGLVKL